MSLNLLINQIEEQFSNSRSNVYSDKKREEHFANIYEVFSAIKSLNTHGIVLDIDTSNFKLILQSVILSDLQYLDSSTLNVIPHEIVQCLQLALKDWIDDDNLILSTYLSNNFNDFYFSPFPNKEHFDDVNLFLQAKSIPKIKYRLIRISLPKILSRDYLSTVALYHELGHFVDLEFNFSQRLLFKKLTKGETIVDQDIAKNHFQEFFADLFAAQYISDASNQYLTDIAGHASASETHPATSIRVEVVDKFLKGERVDIVEEFQEVLSPFNKELKTRFEEKNANETNFYKFTPEVIQNDKQLHYIYKTGWSVWKDTTNPDFSGILERQKYQMLNNLIEKSISSYFLLKGWKDINK
ncbi:hypothetical protein HZP85_09840 [Elizabethkingia anophelis]|nr:hypothetical protein [Elizabethkingia anophelis]MCT4072962.1 hypothetical protein [Elizabethkingia anophelis]